MTAHKIFETKDSAFNLSVEFKLTRALLGLAYTEAPFSREVKMRMVTLHLLCVCFCFVLFSNNEATEEQVRREMIERGRNLNKKKRRQ